MVWIVKLGGSLAKSAKLTAWLDRLGKSGKGKVVLVPGGGDFANQIRCAQQRWLFDDPTAHRMALLSMQQYGLMLSAMHNDFEVAYDVEQIDRVLAQPRVAVWMPDYKLLDESRVEQSWNVSSDSLAAWLADFLGATRLVLLKHLPPVDHCENIQELVELGAIDAAFPKFVQNANFSVAIHDVEDVSGFSVRTDIADRS